MDPKIRKGVTVAVRKGSAVWRDRTQEDHEKWRNSEDSKGMDCAGETKLDSPSRWRKNDGTTFKVVRAAASVRRGWYQVGKCSVLVDSEGVQWYAERKDLAVVSN